jgi:YidC/Oxa1 family membrane protein insertase
VASGLCLYFIASSLWGIGERKLLPKTLPKPGGVITAADKKNAIDVVPSNSGGGGKAKK